ncbi:MAG: efflux RND transporter periplasmic adaptor subunit, partial [Beijerinckiaceae bacterium]
MPARSKIISALLVIGALAGTGYAAATGRVTLPLGLNEPVANVTRSVAGQFGIALTPVTSPQVGPTGQPQGQARAGAAGSAGGPPQRPPVTVRIANAEKRDMPVRFESIGTVQTMASVVVRSRVDSQIASVAFQDGARIKKGDLLFRLDPRQIEAQIAQAEAAVMRTKATLEFNRTDLQRKETLSRLQASTQVLLDGAKAAVATTEAQLKADQAALDNLKVQRTYFEIAAPISGRIGVAGLKEGNMARQGEAAQVLATINQISPIYVAFPVPQRLLPELREASASGKAEVEALPQGLNKAAKGKIAVLENTVDAGTGTIMTRAEFDNDDELLWP